MIRGNTFFMLHVDGGQSPTARHANIEGAMVEAKRLASKEKRPVFVLKAVTMVEEDIQHIYHTMYDPDTPSEMFKRHTQDGMNR